MSDNSHFYRKVSRAGAFAASKDVEREQAVRLFCEFSGSIDESRWLLQVRGPQTLGGGSHGREGKAFMIAGATLNHDDLTALRDAIDALLSEVRP